MNLFRIWNYRNFYIKCLHDHCKTEELRGVIEYSVDGTIFYSRTLTCYEMFINIDCYLTR